MTNETRALGRSDIRALFHPAPGSIYLDTATYGLPPEPTAANELVSVPSSPAAGS